MRVLRLADTTAKVGICDRQLRGLESRGLFPKRFTITPGGKVVGHLESEIDEWIASRAAEREPRAA